MRIVLAGGTGLLARPLIEALSHTGHEVVALTRQAALAAMRPRQAGAGSVRHVLWRPDGSARPVSADGGDAWLRAIDGASAVVNLAGENLGEGRWTAKRKRALRDSRVLPTRSLVAAVRAAAARPGMFIQQSAVGYYGTPDGQARDESFPPGDDFLARLCVDWEAEAHPVSALDCRLVILRTGVVLAREGGAVARLATTFRLFAGGPFGSGRQMMSWIHRDDWVAIVQWALATPSVTGALNACSPQPVTNAEFSKALARALWRPSWLRVPRFALKLAAGEVADVVLLKGQRVVPARALALGFVFQHPEIGEAMKDALRRTGGQTRIRSGV